LVSPFSSTDGQINADRAERLSRYVDAALTDAGILPDASPGQVWWCHGFYS
jgi:hypothetical protein